MFVIESSTCLTEMCTQIMYTSQLTQEPSCVDAMQTLIDRFPDGYEGWAKDRGEEVTPRFP